MTSDKILHASLIDIIFEQRNKAYGAYTLRKFYNNRLAKSLGVMISAVIVFSIIVSLWPAQKVLITKIFDEPRTANLPPADLQPQKPKLPKAQQAAARPHRAQRNLAHLVITNQDIPPIQDIPDNIPTGSITVTGLPDIHVGPPVNVIAEIPAIAAIPSIPDIDHKTPAASAEVMPTFPGGMEALRNFLIKNLKNPQELEEGGSVSVKIKFVVGYDGVLKGFQIAEDGGTEFNNEVIRVLKKMPAWIPGKTKGENVSVYYTIPVKFVSTE